MFCFRCGLLQRLGLSLCALVAAFCPLEGCRKTEFVGEVSKSSTHSKTAESDAEQARYANDLDRLGQLTDRVSRACRASYVVVLGVESSAANSSLVSVDYALFDRLSDDGAAVLIAEAIAAKSMQPLEAQTQVNTNRMVLRADEAVGRYIAEAGFGSDGFAEWLKVKQIFAAGSQQNTVPERMRIAAFMRGYLSASGGK